MVSLDDAIVARYSSHGLRFEILVDPNLAYQYRRNNKIELTDVLATDRIFRDAKKGEKASDSDMQRVFRTTDPLQIADIILMKGELQITADQRRRLKEEKKRKIVDIITRNAVNPQTGYPHSPQRIEQAIAESKINIDPFKEAELQVEKVVEAIRPILPISMEKRLIYIKVPASYAAKAYGIIKSVGEIKSEEWQKDGSLTCNLEIPAGLQEEIYEKLNSITKGEVETKVLTRKAEWRS